MISFLRRIFNSRLGIAFALGFVVLMGLMMVLGDVTNQMGNFGGSSQVQNGEVVRGGDIVISEQQFQDRIAQNMQQAQQQYPNLDRATFARTGGVDRTLKILLDTVGLEAFGKEQGIGASKKMVDGAIASIPAFMGPDGKFSETVYQNVLAQNKITDAQVRADVATGLVAQQILDPIKSGSYVPPSVVKVYAELQLELRSGQVLDIPLSAVPAGPAPTDKELTDFYNKNKARYTVPERRVVRLAPFGVATIGEKAKPTDAQIQAYYDQNKATYAPKETRSLTQVIVPTQNDANTLAAKVKAGTSFDDAAKQAGVVATKLQNQDRAAYAGSAGAAVADAVFNAPSGTVVGPVKSALGWYVVRPESASTSSGKSLAQVRGEIAQKLTAENTTKVLSDTDAKIQEMIDDGQNFDVIAKANGFQVTTLPEITAQGIPYGKGGQPILPPALVKQLFAMGVDDDPTVIVITPNEMFAVVDVSSVTPAAPRPLAEIKDQVSKDFVTERQQAEAKKIADAIIAKVQKGIPLAQAAAESGVRITPRSLAASRQELQQRSPDSPALALMFSMAPNTAKKLERAGNGGWSIVTLNQITKGDLSKNQNVVVGVGKELKELQADEIQSQFADAAGKNVGVSHSAEIVNKTKRTMMGDANN